MATLRTLKRRIASVDSVAHITRSMEMLSVVKIYHLRKKVEESVPYVEKLRELLVSIASHTSTDLTANPLFIARPIEKVLIIPLTSDRGFCGAFNSNVMSLTKRYSEELGLKSTFATIGKKANAELTKQGHEISFQMPGILDKLSFTQAQILSKKIKEMYISDEVQAVSFVYMEFQSVLRQESVVREMLPLVPIMKGHSIPLETFIFKPNPTAILDTLMDNYVDLFVYKVLLEAGASEQAMRRMSMHRATENADDLGQKLTIKYQRTRQAAITKELTEITSGAEAIKERKSV
ncbi:MAG TPA: ATP synthase F1 subunit gamma [Caldisericia bacterium]|nr:ATP synthase F1 subunit gamma [Caldisericia bacterium]HOR47155.1 ATP synthase F1 subunit gamma [Caldisericia bacterium]HOU07954.1 ATP synthase F1 subunit gamma [Caldisericia bacterium]HPL89908.1 ATP synthase F1 subunit gamma [Caldisericia bacterium]HQG58956.1 ATP synthase F1 subunit gamma [Caldisericia bacterium]